MDWTGLHTAISIISLVMFMQMNQTHSSKKNFITLLPSLVATVELFLHCNDRLCNPLHLKRYIRLHSGIYSIYSIANLSKELLFYY